jgi:hypothetical protein
MEEKGEKLPMRGIEEGFIGDDELRPAAELLAAASMEVGRVWGRFRLGLGPIESVEGRWRQRVR